MALKKIINDKPKVGDISQYNFDDSETVFDYTTTTGLPENNDKFQNKDLFTNCVGDKLNEVIIEKNLKFEGESFIKIENLYISNTGVDGTTKSNHVKAWIFSQEAYGGDPTKDGYSTVKSKMKDDWKFYSRGFGNKSENTDIGNITEVEGTSIVSNFGIESPQLELGDFTGKTIDFNSDGGLDAFELSPLESGIDDVSGPSQTSIFNENPSNPIYIVIYMKGHKKIFWPINTDERKRRYDIFKISNFDLFQELDDNFSGLVYQTNFTSATKSKTGEGGGGAQQAAWKVTSLQLSINTSAGTKNQFSGASDYEQFIDQVAPKFKTNKNIFDDFKWLFSTNPNTQLDNDEVAGNTNSLDRHPDFIPFTDFGFSQNNQLGNNYVDLQSYNTNLDLVMKSSVPLNVTFNVIVKNLDETTLYDYYTGDSTFGDGIRVFYYFVIDWNDTEDKFKTIEDWLESRPENNFDYLEKQNENLYKVYKISPVGDLSQPSNVYTTAGIKNIKFVMIGTWLGTGGGTSGHDGFEIGRWKLCTSRIYLDIPPNRYPDFSVVGGADYTTLPWPFTTPIIGGMSNDSKYKKSIQNTLSGGKVGEFDIIDEKFLVNDLENDEMGKNVETMDLEQCRYFNTSYSISELLNIDIISEVDNNPNSLDIFYNPTSTLADNQNPDTSPEYLATLPFPQYIEEFDFNGNGEIDSEDAGEWANYGLIDRPDISEYLFNLIGGLDNPTGNYYTYPDYVYNWNSVDDIPDGVLTIFNSHNDNYWDGETNKFSEETSVGQIFIGDNSDLDLKQSCKLELNTGELTGKSILDTSGNSNKGLLIGDYKVKKVKKGQFMRRDSFIKVPKKVSNKNGAL